MNGYQRITAALEGELIVLFLKLTPVNPITNCRKNALGILVPVFNQKS